MSGSMVVLSLTGADGDGAGGDGDGAGVLAEAAALAWLLWLVWLDWLRTTAAPPPTRSRRPNAMMLRVFIDSVLYGPGLIVSV